MLFTKIWERYFLKEVLKTFFLFLVCFYGLYILIDYTNHGRSFHKGESSFWYAFCLYYLCEFINRSEVLIPFAIVLGTTRTLCKLNDNNEIVAMMASGIKASRLLRPFLMLGLFFTALMYFNMEYTLPAAAKELKYFNEIDGKKKNKSAPLSVEHVILEDNSTLLFQSYDTKQKFFFDAYWVRSIDEIYKIKQLFPYSKPPEGHFVDRLLRNDKDELVVNASHDLISLPELKFDAKRLKETLVQPENLPLTKLWKQLPENHDAQSEKEARMLSTFHRKLAIPWLCLLAVLAPAPFCMRFSRQFPTFLVYAGCLFGLIGIYIIIDAAHVLGRRQLLDPFYALWTPFMVFFLIFGWRYVRLR
ncbi:MAG: LptF/LptG family permease [Parachlamydiaceae bacterium]|nr:LptF/LptG family permease [Parachlamydiaceae bacterium]